MLPTGSVLRILRYSTVVYKAVQDQKTWGRAVLEADGDGDICIRIRSNISNVCLLREKKK